MIREEPFSQHLARPRSDANESGGILGRHPRADGDDLSDLGVGKIETSKQDLAAGGAGLAVPGQKGGDDAKEGNQ